MVVAARFIENEVITIREAAWLTGNYIYLLYVTNTLHRTFIDMVYAALLLFLFSPT